MNIRKFEADTFEEALNRVKAELGPDALILASEEKRHGWFQKPTVEITAAFDADPVKEKEWDEEALEKVFPHRKRQVSNVESKYEYAPRTRSQSASKAAQAAQAPQPLVHSVCPTTTEVERSFREVGVRAETAKDFARQITLDYPKKDRMDPSFVEKLKIKMLANGLRTLSPEIFKSRRTWSAVGSSGSGKTSLLVKLALALRGQGQTVRLSSCDGRKVLARHEMAAYAKLIDVPFQPGRVGEKPASHVLLQDTPSLGVNQVEIFKEIERNCRDASVLVVLDASQRLGELLRTVDRFTNLAPVALAFTRLDLVSDAGVIYEVLKQTKLPLLGVSQSAGFSSAFRFHEPTSLARYLVHKPFEIADQLALIQTAAQVSTESAI